MKLFQPTKFNVHETCIPSPLPKLTGFLFINMNHIHLLSKNKVQFLQTFHLFQVVGVQLFHFLSLHKPCTHPGSLSVDKISPIFGVQMLLYSWYPFTNESTSKFFVTTFGISSFCVSFVCETFSISFFFSCFWSCFFSVLMLCIPGFYFIFQNNVSFKTASGKSKVITPKMVAGWNEATLPTLLSNYGLENIYNADEFRLFYHRLPDKSY